VQQNRTGKGACAPENRSERTFFTAWVLSEVRNLRAIFARPPEVGLVLFEQEHGNACQIELRINEIRPVRDGAHPLLVNIFSPWTFGDFWARLLKRAAAREGDAKVYFVAPSAGPAGEPPRPGYRSILEVRVPARLARGSQTAI
jgi:hypothetical protein